MKKTTLLMLLFFCFCLTCHAQTGNDSIADQREFKNDLLMRSADNLVMIEKVYLHTDRTYYYAGDDIWFKAYLIDALDRIPTDHSNNLHVELISPSSEIISSRVIRLDSGLGHGDFKLAAGLKSGRYKIRAYTNYMRNFSDQLFFNKEIFISNSDDNDNDNKEQVKYVENKTELSFFPEGGSLVDNVSSIVAFKAVNNLGKGCDVAGKVYSSAGDLITTFRSSRLGMGSFFLRPLPGLSYYSVSRGADSVDFRSPLPASFPVGVTFSTSTNRNNELIFTAKTNTQTLAMVTNQELLLSFSIRKDVFRTVTFKMNSPLTSFVIPTDNLPDGILMLTLSGPKDLPLAERLIYNEWEPPVKIRIETDKSLYNKKEPVSLRLSLSGDSTIERDGNVSLAVVDGKLIENTTKCPRTISSWFLLEADIRGNIEDPSYYFDPSNPERLKDLDLLLRTQGWRDFTWKYDSNYFLPENGFTVSGRLGRFYSKKSIDSSRVSIGIFESNNTFFKTLPVDSSGRFCLTGLNVKGEAKLIVSGIDKKDRMKGLLTLDSLTYIPAKVSYSPEPDIILTEATRSELKTSYRISEAIRKKYKLSDTINLGGVNIISERHNDPQTIKVERSRSMYGKPDAELILTPQMESYQSLVDIMRSNRLPGVEVQGPSGNPKIRIRNPGSFMGSAPPLFLVDGNPAIIEDLISMPISFADRIDVLKSVSSSVIYGIRGYFGVINIITKAGGGTYSGVSHSVNLRISGYNDSRIFYSPQHLPDTNPYYQPDLRSTLLWKPDINLEGDKDVIVKYYNGDNPSIVLIIAEGITSTGIPVTGKAEYEIR